jgi:hypothetical protein
MQAMAPDVEKQQQHSELERIAFCCHESFLSRKRFIGNCCLLLLYCCVTAHTVAQRCAQPYTALTQE